MNRRDFLRHAERAAGTLAFGAGAVLPSCESHPTLPEPETRPPLRIPPNIRATDSLLSAGAAELDLGRHTSRAWGYDGALPGPTLRALVGEHAKISVRNQLPEDTTVHWHGLVVPPSMDGHPADALSPGTSYDYEYPDPAAGRGELVSPASPRRHRSTGVARDGGSVDRGGSRDGARSAVRGQGDPPPPGRWTAGPIHFQVLSRSGGRGRVFAWEQGWKDTVLLENRERVEIAIRFDSHRGVYLLHCHKLEHEDAGMMLNFEVNLREP